MNDHVLHALLVGLLLTIGTILIIFAHQWISPEVVFSTIIAGLAGIIGGRLVSNNYNDRPPVSGSSDKNKNTNIGGTNNASS
jgi:uncharacterized membrane protein